MPFVTILAMTIISAISVFVIILICNKAQTELDKYRKPFIAQTYDLNVDKSNDLYKFRFKFFDENGNLSTRDIYIKGSFGWFMADFLNEYTERVDRLVKETKEKQE